MASAGGYFDFGEFGVDRQIGETPCEIIEIISPAGLEDYFRELSAIWPDRRKSAEILRRYELEMQIDSVAELCQRFGLRPTGPGTAPRF